MCIYIYIYTYIYIYIYIDVPPACCFILENPLYRTTLPISSSFCDGSSRKAANLLISSCGLATRSSYLSQMTASPLLRYSDRHPATQSLQRPCSNKPLNHIAHHASNGIPTYVCVCVCVCSLGIARGLKCFIKITYLHCSAVRFSCLFGLDFWLHLNQKVWRIVYQKVWRIV